MSFKLLKSTFVIGFMTSISRVFGLIRDVVIGSLFGPGLGVDVFIVSFRNLYYILQHIEPNFIEA